MVLDDQRQVEQTAIMSGMRTCKHAPAGAPEVLTSIRVHVVDQLCFRKGNLGVSLDTVCGLVVFVYAFWYYER